ncbi:hypothetical protein DFH06DRAFT_559989 [Mycena polygramma]|nr:hypothetical protein DFH06DRAFT_559989 [Mycena polygramma]
MKAATACLLFTALLVNAFPTPDLPVPTLLAAQIDSDCANNACPIASLSILGSAGGATTYALDGIPFSVDPENTLMAQDPSPTETLIEGPDGYTLLHIAFEAGQTLSVEDDCTFIAGGSSAVNCVQHFGEQVSTATNAEVQTLRVPSPLSDQPSPTGKTGSNGGVRSSDVRGIGCALIMVIATAVITLRGW